MMELLERFDVALLTLVWWGMTWLEDWLSLRQRTLERALIAIYAGGMVGWDVVEHMSAWWYVVDLLIVTGMVSRHRIAARDRVFRLIVGEGMLSRLSAVLLSVFFALLLVWLLSPGWEWRVSTALMAIFNVVMYLTAWPDDAGGGGKKRKAAIAKIVDSFGREYVPDGAGA